MALFRRKPKEELGPEYSPKDLNERSPKLGVRWKDVEVMAQLVKSGADLTQPRHVLYFLYLNTETDAESAAGAARDAGYRAAVDRAVDGDKWSMIAEIIAITDPPTVIAADDLFQSLADTLGGEYDGWEASVSTMTELPAV
jgi:hypothetical protein